MIVDMRTYICHPGKMAAWLKVYEEYAWPLQQKYLGNCLGFYTSAEGKLNTVVHLWGFESQADREAKRAAMVQDPAWNVFMEKAAALGALAVQENSILKPAPFFAAK
jgi:hypothetical protein